MVIKSSLPSPYSPHPQPNHNTPQRPIPSQLGAASKNMIPLIFHHNYLTGTTPPEWVGMDSLEKLYLYTNALTCTITPNIFSILSLQQI